MDAAPIVVLDNGGGDIKASVLFHDGRSASTQVTVPNAVATRNKVTLVGPALHEGRRDLSGFVLRRPVERGVVTHWDLQREIWADLFTQLKVNPRESLLIVTEAPGTPIHARHAMDSLVFEEFGFLAYLPCSAAELAALSVGCRNGIVLDCGFSHTHAVPVVDGRCARTATRRLNVGGKVLTNLLKETVSYRSWNMMEETQLMNHIKEKLCFVSQHFLEDLNLGKRTAGKSLLKEYVLPDRASEDSDRLGHVRGEEDGDGFIERENEQVLMLTNERISVPEVLFSPMDIGLNQCGVAELVVQSAESAPEKLRPALYSSVVLTGGASLFGGLPERLEAEVRQLVPSHFAVNVLVTPNRSTAAVAGGLRRAGAESFYRSLVTREEFLRHGHAYVVRKMMDGQAPLR